MSVHLIIKFDNKKNDFPKLMKKNYLFKDCVTIQSILNSTLTAMTAKVYAKSPRNYKLLTTRLIPFLIKVTLKFINKPRLQSE